MKKLSHNDQDGRAVMVDVSAKIETVRRATASAFVRLSNETLAILRESGGPKGNVLETARLAGIMGAKRTAELIPLCHQIELNKVDVAAEFTAGGVSLRSEALSYGRTGVEMEALTAVTIAALTIYDMCKAVQRDIEITDIRLETKTGGKEDYQRPAAG